MSRTCSSPSSGPPSGLGKGLNFAYYDDPDLDKKIDAQSRETDPAKRKTLVADIEKYAMDTKAYQYPVLWWYRIIPYLKRRARLAHRFEPLHQPGPRDVWLAK